MPLNQLPQKILYELKVAVDLDMTYERNREDGQLNFDSPTRGNDNTTSITNNSYTLTE